MQLELSPEEAEVLVGALRSYVSDLRVEIAGTDKMPMRQNLKSQDRVLDGIIDRLSATTAQ